MKPLVLSAALALVPVAATALEIVPAYNVYDAAPFVLELQQNAESQGGLANDLVRYLNDKLQDRYRFELLTMPRERLNQAVINQPDFKGVVLFLHPQFVGDSERKKFSWTAPIMSDKNLVLSPVGKPIEYSGPDSLTGRYFVGVRGNKYAGLEERFGKDIKRYDVTKELLVLNMIAANRGDAALMNATIFNYLMKVNGKSDELEGKLHVSATPHLQFERHLFVANASVDLARALEPVAARMAKDKDWQAIVAKYGGLTEPRRPTP